MMNGFFEDKSSTEGENFEKVDLKLLHDFLKELKQEFSQNRWSFEEGFHYILAAGLAALKNARQPNLISPSESMIISDLQSERIRMHGRYSAMKHQVGQLSQQVKSLEVQLKATKNLCEIYRKLSLVENRSED